jgi:hypothetical protein
MSVLSRFRDHNRRTAVRIHNQTRVSLSILAPAFIAAAILGAVGGGETRANGEPVVGSARLVVAVVLFALGSAMGFARRTVFRHRRELE